MVAVCEDGPVDLDGIDDLAFLIRFGGCYLEASNVKAEAYFASRIGRSVRSFHGGRLPSVCETLGASPPPLRELCSWEQAYDQLKQQDLVYGLHSFSYRRRQGITLQRHYDSFLFRAQRAGACPETGAERTLFRLLSLPPEWRIQIRDSAQAVPLAIAGLAPLLTGVEVQVGDWYSKTIAQGDIPMQLWKRFEAVGAFLGDVRRTLTESSLTPSQAWRRVLEGDRRRIEAPALMPFSLVNKFVGPPDVERYAAIGMIDAVWRYAFDALVLTTMVHAHIISIYKKGTLPDRPYAMMPGRSSGLFPE